jgi:hypothetical protein
MKKFVATIAAISMLAMPAVAEAHGRNDGHRHRHGGVSTGGAVAIGLGALILGSAIANSNRRNQQVYEPRYEPRYEPQYVCQNEYVRDYNGNYILDRYGRAIYTQRCWYQ